MININPYLTVYVVLMFDAQRNIFERYFEQGEIDDIWDRIERNSDIEKAYFIEIRERYSMELIDSAEVEH
jgi:hypothetical protein